jgi:hypothetical protein
MECPNRTISYEARMLAEVRWLREMAEDYEVGSLMYDTHMNLADDDLAVLKKHRSIPSSSSPYP